jgi:GNAT superfamily N-acetyltransferase
VTAPTTEVTVRAARPADLESVVRLRLALLREQPDHPIYSRLRPDAEMRARSYFAEQLESPSETMFLAESDGKVVGIIRCVMSRGSPLLSPTNYAYVSSAYVVPELRRQGVLRLLLSHAESWCLDHGLGEMRLHNVAGDAVAEEAWSALGFEIVEQVRWRPLAGGR